MVLDRHSIDRLGITVVPQDPAPVPTLGEIVATLNGGGPVVIEGPEPGWCVQGIAQIDDKSIRIEVPHPEHWETGPALPRGQRQVIEALGFRQQPGMWVRLERDDDGVSAVSRAAEVMLAVAERAWGLEVQGALRLDDLPAIDAPWEQIAEFAHTLNGYAHFGEQWGERFNAIRERYFETGALSGDLDDLRACLFCEFRADRFTWGDDVALSEPDPEGVRHVVANPDFESSPTQKYRRAIIARIRELLAQE